MIVGRARCGPHRESVCGGSRRYRGNGRRSNAPVGRWRRGRRRRSAREHPSRGSTTPMLPLSAPPRPGPKFDYFICELSLDENAPCHLHSVPKSHVRHIETIAGFRLVRAGVKRSRCQLFMMSTLESNSAPMEIAVSIPKGGFVTARADPVALGPCRPSVGRRCLLRCGIRCVCPLSSRFRVPSSRRLGCRCVHRRFC